MGNMKRRENQGKETIWRDHMCLGVSSHMAKYMEISHIECSFTIRLPLLRQKLEPEKPSRLQLTSQVRTTKFEGTVIYHIHTISLIRQCIVTSMKEMDTVASHKTRMIHCCGDEIQKGGFSKVSLFAKQQNGSHIVVKEPEMF